MKRRPLPVEQRRNTFGDSLLIIAISLTAIAWMTADVNAFVEWVEQAAIDVLEAGADAQGLGS